MKISMALAKTLAGKIGAGLDVLSVRERVDILTGVELDCVELDLLTDWVESEIQRDSRAKE